MSEVAMTMRSPVECSRFCAVRGCEFCAGLPVPASAGGVGGTAATPALKLERSSPEGPIPIVVVGGDPVLRAALGRIFSTGEFRSGGFFPTAEAVLRAIPELPPSVVLVDILLPDLCGIRCAREIVARRPEVKTILLTALNDPDLLRHASDAGISACLVLPFRLDQCLATLRLVAWQPTGKPSAEPGVLNRRECQVMAELADGKLYKEIGDDLRLSSAVVKKLQHRIYQKLHADNRTKAIANWGRIRGDPSRLDGSKELRPR
jgi:DNA-binding NarL/FixJ family response regulator